MALDVAGNLYVAEFNNDTIRMITPAGVVTTLAGLAGYSGTNDGIGSTARFSALQGVAVNSAGNVYVADLNNQRISKGTPLLPFDTAIGVMISNATFQALLIGPSGSNVVVESSGNLTTWMPVQTNALPAVGLHLSVPLGANQNQLFRARFAP